MMASETFRGLLSKLDYLRNLGVTVIWLLPFYPSPLRDDGYDIADYYKRASLVWNPGMIFDNSSRPHMKPGSRVITELVLNHTSDQHNLVSTITTKR